MTKFVRVALTLSACTLLASAPAFAQATRTWVSGVGDDANPCSRTAPCKTFAGAISKTATGGEISVLDPGGFGAVTITKSITINGDGTLAGILAAGTNGIIVNAPASSVVVLRNISIHGAGTGINGVRIISASRVIIDKVDVMAFTTNSIDVNPSIACNVTITDSHLKVATRGVRVVPGAGRVDVSIKRTTIEATNNGVDATGGFVNVDDSIITQNPGFGVLSQGAGSINVENSQLTSNGTAVLANAGTVRLTNNGVYENATAFGCGGGTLLSNGGNRVAGNPGAGCAPAGVVPVQ